MRELELQKSAGEFKTAVVSKLPPYSHSANLACFWQGHKKAAVTMALTACVILSSAVSRLVQ